MIAAAERFDRESPGLVLLSDLRTDGYIQFLPVTKEILDIAAAFWAKASNQGKSNKDKKNIDVDVILRAHYQWLENRSQGRRIIIATKNIKDFTAYCEAMNWQDIKI